MDERKTLKEKKKKNTQLKELQKLETKSLVF